MNVTLRELLEAGVHFGHQTGRWNPKMKQYIFIARNGIYIIDLKQTMKAWKRALKFLEEIAGSGGKVLFVGTKRQAQEIISEEARRCSQFYVNHRWLGGLLTNYQTISKSIDRYRELESMAEDGRFDLLPKREVLSLKRELFKLQRNLVGIKDMGGLPDAVFVIDVRRERIAVKEAMKLGIPVVAVVDTNCDPEGIEFVIPGNDDAIRAIRLFCRLAADAIAEGRVAYEDELQVSGNGAEAEGSDTEGTVAESADGEPTSPAGEETVADDTEESSPEAETAGVVSDDSAQEPEDAEIDGEGKDT